MRSRIVEAILWGGFIIAAVGSSAVTGAVFIAVVGH